MNRTIKAVLGAGALVLGTAGAASAYTPTNAAFGQYVGTNEAGTIATVDMNVELTGTQYYHEFDLSYACGTDGVITFTGVGKQFDNEGETINGSLDTTNRTLTYTATYWSNGAPDTRVWSVSGATLAGTNTYGSIEWSGNYAGAYPLAGGLYNVPNCAPAPAPGNHGQFVSGAVKAGMKGQNLKDIAGNVNLTGAYYPGPYSS